MVIARKSKKAILSDICILILLAMLIALSIYRFFGDFRPILKVLYIGLALAGVFYFVKNLLVFFQTAKAPRDLILDEGTSFKCFVKKEYISIQKEDIKEVRISTSNTKNFLLFKQTLIIIAGNNAYVIERLEDANNVKQLIEEK